MKFNADGYLDAGIHDHSLDEIEEHLVVGFPTSTNRPTILAGYKRHRIDVEALGLECEQFLDGSFVSTKNEPGDIDLVGFIDVDTVDALDAADTPKFLALFAGPATKATHSCDAYYCPMVPHTDPRYLRLRTSRKYWMGEFGYDRNDKPKGIIRTVISPPPAAAGTAPGGANP